MPQKPQSKTPQESDDQYSVIPRHSIYRTDIRWEDYIHSLTPVSSSENGLWIKREDLFCPLGYGSINGTKLRQLIYLIHKTWEADVDRKLHTIVHGTTRKSPQTPLVPLVAAHYGYETIQVTGGKISDTSLAGMAKDNYIQTAMMLDTQFKIVNPGYPAVLNKHVAEILDTTDGTFTIERDITVNHKTNSAEDVREFHMSSADQVKNIPDMVTDLIIPFGSANSACSIILGLSIYGSKNIERVHLIGLDPKMRRVYLEERLDVMGVSLNDVEFVYHDMMNMMGYTYDKLVNDVHVGGVHMHPRYEAKCYTYISEYHDHLICETSLFWNVATTMDTAITAETLDVQIPDDVILYDVVTKHPDPVMPDPMPPIDD